MLRINSPARLLAIAALALTAGCLDDEPNDERDTGADVPVDASDVGDTGRDADAADVIDADTADAIDDAADTIDDAADAIDDADTDTTRPPDAVDADAADVDDTADVGPTGEPIEVLHLEYNLNPDGFTPDVLAVLDGQPADGFSVELSSGEMSETIAMGDPLTARFVFQSTGFSGAPSSFRLGDDDEYDCVITQTNTNSYRCSDGGTGIEWQLLPADGHDGRTAVLTGPSDAIAEFGFDGTGGAMVDETAFAFVRQEFEYRAPTGFSPPDGEPVDTSVADERDDEETKQAKNRRVEFILLRGVFVDDVFSAETTPGVYELAAVSNSGDSGPPPEMQAFADGIELEQSEDRLQRVFQAGVEEFGTTEFEVVLTFFDEDTPVDSGQVPVALGAEWATGFSDGGAPIGVRFDSSADSGDQLTVTLDGESTATRFEAELVGAESSVFAFGGFLGQWRTATWVNDVFGEGDSVEIVVLAENEHGFEEVTRTMTGAGVLADRPDTYPNATQRRGLLDDALVPLAPSAEIVHLVAEQEAGEIRTETAVRLGRRVPADLEVEVELSGFEPVVRSDWDFAVAAVEIPRPDGPVTVTIDGLDEEFTVDRDVVDIDSETVENLTVTLDPRGGSLLVTLIGPTSAMEEAGATPGARIVRFGDDPHEPFVFYDVVFLTSFEGEGGDAPYGLVATTYSAEEVLDVAEVSGSLNEDALVEEIVVLDNEDRVEIAVTAQVESLEPTTVSVAVVSEEGEFFVEEQVTPAAVERVFVGAFDGIRAGDDTVTVSLGLLDEGDATLDEFEFVADIDAGWVDIEAGERVLSVNIRRDNPEAEFGEVVLSVIGEDGVQGTVAQAQEVAGIVITIDQPRGPSESPVMAFRHGRRGYTFISRVEGLAGLRETGTAELVVDVAQEGRTTETVTGGLGPVPSISTSRKFVKKYKGKTKFDRKMNESFTD